MMFTVSRVVEQTPLLIIHSKLLTPMVSPVTPEVGLLGVETDPVPLTTVHEPVPTVGVFPARVAVAAHTA